MAKHRKTRREKKVADNRHSLYHLELTSTQVNIPVNSPIKDVLTIPVERPDYKPTNTYTYVLTDIKKTLFITSAIIIAQLFLFLVLNRI